jgi:glycosyltransferase involved in cell wall biosynthesis
LRGSTVRIDLVFPVLPPALDGIGDHTAHLARALARRGCRVRVLSTQAAPAPIPGVDVVDAFGLDPIWRVRDLASAVRHDPPDWLFVQFNQFSYGPWGFNPFLPWTLARLRAACPRMRLAVMAHEEFVPATHLRNAIMSLWQRAQFLALCRLADYMLYSTSAWVRKFRGWFPDTRGAHLPVGSNIPRSSMSRAEARAKIGVRAPLVVGYFGSTGGSRRIGHVRAALSRLQDLRPGGVELLYIGQHGAALRQILAGIPVHDAGPLPEAEVADGFAAMDLYVAPFVKGVSTRRGSFMAGLQHGVPTVSTIGAQTDPVLREQNGAAFLLTAETSHAAFAEAAASLAQTPSKRRALGREAASLYRRAFDWPVLAQQLETYLRPLTTPSPTALPT